MEQGKTKIARSLLELQPTAILEFFVVYPNYVEHPNRKRYFHGGSVFNQKIVWQGQTYRPLPVEVEGFESMANGQLPRPKIRFSNKEYFMSSVIAKNDDFKHARVIRKRTFLKYLDDVNFSDNLNPWGEADSTAELSNEMFLVGQKTAENKIFVEFELISPLDIDNQDITRRIIMSRYCCWQYRGAGCNYTQQPVADVDNNTLTYSGTWNEDKNDPELEWEKSPSTANPEDTAYASGSWVYLENKNVIIRDVFNPNLKTTLKTWYRAKKLIKHKNNFVAPSDNDDFWAKDDCSKTVTGCKLRFGSGPLSFGGFPGTDKYGAN